MAAEGIRLGPHYSSRFVVQRTGLTILGPTTGYHEFAYTKL